MADILGNFSCSDPSLSRNQITEEVWMLESQGSFHENSVIVLAVVLLLFLLVGIPWNVVVVIMIIVKGLYKEPTYILLLNLVIADLLVYTLVMPLNIGTALSMKFIFGNSDYERCSVCQATVVGIVCLVFVSLFSLALMSVDRLVYIKWAFQYEKYVKMIPTLFAVFVMWIFCIAVSILPVFGIGEVKYANVLSFCSPIISGRTHVTSNSTYFIIVILTGLLPFLMALVANLWLLGLVCKSIHTNYKKNKGNTESRCKDPIMRRISTRQLKLDYHKQQLVLAKVFGAIFVANVITWIPIIVIFLVDMATGGLVPPYVYIYMVLAFLSQPFVHPILETCLVGRARSMTWQCLVIVCRKKKKKKLFSLNNP